MKRVAKATGALLQTTVNNVTSDVLGTCGKFQEKQIGAERYNLFEECPHVIIINYFRLNQQQLF
jgi:T-complex protein 1 subunit eta